MARWIGLVAVLLASQAGYAASEIVEAGTVTNVVASSEAGWDLNGCGVEGCDPRLTRDGKDNTVPSSRWSCEPSLAESLGYTDVCSITFDMDDYFLIDHIMLYLHESDAAQISIPFTVDDQSDLTSTGLALGVGEKTAINEELSSFTIEFDLTNGQYINLSEVEIFVDVTDPGSLVVPAPTELHVVNAKTVTNVVASAESWELGTDIGCGPAGCVPDLVTDGQNNTVDSRWSCTVPSEYDSADYLNDEHSCHLTFTMDDEFTISHVVVYVPDSDDPTKAGTTSFVLGEDYDDDGIGFYSFGFVNGFTVPFELTETAVGAGQRVNLPRPSVSYFEIGPASVVAGQVVEISEVEIFVEVTNKNVPISAAEAWNDVTADALTTVTPSSSFRLPDTTAGATRDGDDNTVAASRWACDGTGDGTGEPGVCELYFEFQDEFTVSYLELYMHESETTTAAVPLDICTCDAYDKENNACCEWGTVVGTYLTKPGTPLGTPERVNVMRPLTTTIAIGCSNLTAVGTVSISEVEIYLRTPDGNPTPAPFQSSPAPTPTPYEYLDSSYDDDLFNDDLFGGYNYDDIVDRYGGYNYDDIVDRYGVPGGIPTQGAGTPFSKGSLLWAVVGVVMAVVSTSLF